MMISYLPVLPPNLRPLLQLEQGQMVSSDLNQLYQRIINRNFRLETQLRTDPLLSGGRRFWIDYNQRLVHEAVDTLINNGRASSYVARDLKGRNLKSLSELLKGKQGRFRMNLLGKRANYSGRSVIIVGPE